MNKKKWKGEEGCFGFESINGKKKDKNIGQNNCNRTLHKNLVE